MITPSQHHVAYCMCCADERGELYSNSLLWCCGLGACGFWARASDVLCILTAEFSDFLEKIFLSGHVQSRWRLDQNTTKWGSDSRIFEQLKLNDFCISVFLEHDHSRLLVVKPVIKAK